MTSNKFFSICYLETVNEEYRCLPQHIFHNYIVNFIECDFMDKSNFYYAEHNVSYMMNEV